MIDSPARNYLILIEAVPDNVISNNQHYLLLLSLFPAYLSHYDIKWVSTLMTSVHSDINFIKHGNIHFLNLSRTMRL